MPPVLQLEGEVRGVGGVGFETPQRDRRRTRQAQTDICGSGPRESGPQGFTRKKALTPAEKREVVHTLREAHGVSIASEGVRHSSLLGRRTIRLYVIGTLMIG